ncbi:MAG: 30S ribosomal protein S6 [Fusobacterium sp.]|nr:30S ribosomal protein S6 [Fusobacterium sp.]
MKNYELMVVFKPNLDTEEVNAVVEKLSSTVSEMGGKVESVDKVGRKKLAYEVAGFRDGFFSTVILALPEAQVAEFKRQLRLNDNVIRTMFTEACVKA